MTSHLQTQLNQYILPISEYREFIKFTKEAPIDLEKAKKEQKKQKKSKGGKVNEDMKNLKIDSWTRMFEFI